MSQSTGGGGPWPSKETNSVKPSPAEEPTNRDDRDRQVLERVAEFCEAYPDLADRRVCETHGRKLRRIVTETEYETVTVDAHDDRPQDDSYQMEELRERRATTWADTVAAFLNAHVKYDGLTARFGNGEGDTFDVALNDSWGIEYNDKQYARARALEREMSGGERPSGIAPPPAWDDPMTAMLTLTASSAPDGDRLAPVDHLDAVHDSFSYDGTRDALRNTMEYHLDLGADDWGYWLQTEPHGVGGDGGLNACHTHIHVAVYLDGGALGPERVGSELERVIDKHVEVCDPAGPGAHDYAGIERYTDSDGCISVNADVSNLGSYLASYLGAGHEEELLDRPVEYIAWGALYWATGRRRTSRAQIVNDAIAADRCAQRHESEFAQQSVAHGEQVVRSDANGPDVVCARCRSGWRIDQSRLDEVPGDGLGDQDDDNHGDHAPDDSLRSRWPSADAAASYSEPLADPDVRKKIQTYIDRCSTEPTFPQVKGALHLADQWDDLARSMLDGENAQPEPESFARASASDEWELQAIVDADGECHSPGGGGVDMVNLRLPNQPIETSLCSISGKSSRLRCECGVAADIADMALHLATHGIDDTTVVREVVSPVSMLP